ncbi:MAG: FAD-binding protein [Rhizomicrobium sp.]
MAEIFALSEADVLDAVRAAREHRRALEIVGGGTRQSFGRPTQCDDVLNLSGLSGILNYEPEELIVTVKPGTPLADIESVLSEKNQRLGFEPQDWRALLGSQGTPTIGGAISANANGPAAIRFGRARDHLLGFRAVNGFGEAYKGGSKVVKNVTGFDLPKLMCGAMGTLGVLTEVTLRVFPKREVSSTFAIGGLQDEEGLALLRKVWSSSLEATCVALLSNGVARQLGEMPQRGGGIVNGSFAVIRLEGSSSTLSEKSQLLNDLLKGCSPVEIEASPTLFAGIGGASFFENALEDVWLLQIPHTTAADCVYDFDGRWSADWAGTRLWLSQTAGLSGSDWRSVADRVGSTAILVRASEETRKRVAPFHPEQSKRTALTRAVKAAFDPLGIFNPGRMYEGV